MCSIKYKLCLSLFSFEQLQGSTSASSIVLPFSAWPYLNTILFGIILIFYVDSIAEERYVIMIAI